MARAAVFRKAVDAIKDMVSEANIDCTPGGITLQAMDSNHVALVSLDIDAGAFEHYTCGHNISIGVNLIHMSKILKCGGNDDSLTLMVRADAQDVLMVLFESRDSISDFQLKLMDIDSEQLGIPEVDFSATVAMASTEFQRICRDLQTLGDALIVSVDSKGVKFAVHGAIGSGTMTVLPTLSETSDARASIECTTPVCRLAFALRYLNLFTKATPLAETVTLHLSDAIPLMVKYDVQDVGTLRYYLAPKMEEE